MKLATHVAAASAAAGIVATVLNCSPPCTLYAILTAATANLLIDLYGHEVRAGVPRRGRISHSSVGPLIASLPMILVATTYMVYVRGIACLPSLVAYILASLTGAYSHLLLDAVTEGGVYVSPRRVKRVRIARLPYNHPIANLAVMLVSLLALIIVALRQLGLVLR